MRALATLLLLTGCVAANSEQACRVVPVATARLRMVGNLPLLTVRIDDKPARLLLDTGSSAALINDPAAERLGLRFVQGATISNVSLDSNSPVRLSTPVRIVVGELALKPVTIAVTRAATGFAAGDRLDGVLGLNALDGYDLDIDLPHRRLTLLEPRNCPAGPSPLPGRSVTYPYAPSMFGLIFMPVRVNGIDLLALVDTGANVSALDSAQVGLSEADLAGDKVLTAKTTGPATVATRVHRFDEVQVGDLQVRNGTFATTKLPIGMGAIVGTDFWRTHRLWISFLSRTITVQLGAAPAGGGEAQATPPR